MFSAYGWGQMGNGYGMACDADEVKNIPALPGRGFSKQMQLLWTLSLFLMKTDVFLDYFRSYFVPHRPSEVSILPELSTP